jgi:hypothetical protein
MSTSLITFMSASHQLMRSTATTVLIAFSLMILQPTIAAAQTAKTPKATVTPDNNAETQLSRTLQRIEDKLARTEDKLQKHQDASAERHELKQLRQTIKQLDATVREGFAQVEQHIQDHHLDPVILERHQAMVDHYQQELQNLTDELDGLETSGDDNSRLVHAKSAKDRLKAQRNKRPQQPFDPKSLPFQSSEQKARPPKETKDELKQILSQNLPVQVAALEITGDMLAQTAASTLNPVPADLSATEDVQITDDIKALAAHLNHQPVAIYNWVRNNIDYIPTYGSIQGSQQTLNNKRGNAFDTASLLIALLRASNIPARYAYGTVQIPVEKVMNWVGGVETPLAALQLMGQGGIPNIALAQGGVIKYAKLEHIWVEAWVDYMPSRGAKHKAGDSWVPMDASFKQYNHSKGMDIQNTVPFDTQGLIEQVMQSAQINTTEGSITGIDQNQIKTLLDAYQTQLDTYIKQTKTDATVGDVIGNRIIPSQDNPILVSGLPYQLLQSAGNFAVMPTQLRHQINFRFYASTFDQATDSPLFSYSTTLPKLGNQRVTFAYEPSTDADKAVLDSAFKDHQTRFPAYLVNMTPVIKIEGQRVARSGSFVVGTDQIFTVEIKTPWYSQPRHYQVSSGDLWVLGVNSAGITSPLFDKRAQTHDLSIGDQADFTEETFNQIILGYWGELNNYKEIIASTSEIKYHQLPSHGFAGSPVSVIYNFGIPRWASYKSRVLDVKENRMSVVHTRNENAPNIEYGLKTGMLASYLESGIYDQAFLMEPGYSMSAVTALAKANELNIPIYHITDANLSVALNKLTVDADIKNDINNAVNAGLEVTVSRDSVVVADFTGAGYIITDPATGSGSYRISGGRDGNNSPAPPLVYPLVQVSAPLIGLMTRSLTRNAGVNLVAENGVMMGLAVSTTGNPPIDSSVSQIAAVIMVVSMLLSAYMSEINERYPEKEKPIIFRKYAEEWVTWLNFTTRMIRESRGDNLTFGQGVVYLALRDKDDSELQNLLGHVPVGCPPSADQRESLAIAYDLPDEKSPKNPAMAESYIDIAVTRDNILDYQERPNANEVTEITVSNPLLRVPGSDYRFLIFDVYSIGIRFDDVCF